jgi:hypothetical protein
MFWTIPILVGVDEENMELVVGIIDFMRQYDILKQMERVLEESSDGCRVAKPQTIIQLSAIKRALQMPWRDIS